jgi:prephenate dehydrogenase
MEGIERVTIIGTGLLGGSIGLGLRAAGWGGTIIGVGRRRETVERAKQLGCIDEAATEIGPAVAESQLVVMATPLGAFRAALDAIAAADHDRLIITDVGSAKQRVCDDAKLALPDPTRFVGSHPMAGSEKQGPQHADADLFRGRLCILTPEGTAAGEHAIATVSGLWRTLGMRLTTKTPREHDRLMAAISHLPHAAAALLVGLADRKNALGVAATGFRDTTRVASGDPTVWCDIFKTNRPAVVEAMNELIESLQDFRDMLADGQDEHVFALLEAAKGARDRWVEGEEA